MPTGYVPALSLSQTHVTEEETASGGWGQVIGPRPRSQEVAQPVRGPVCLTMRCVPSPLPCPLWGGTYRKPKGLMVNLPVGKATLPS